MTNATNRPLGFGLTFFLSKADTISLSIMGISPVLQILSIFERKPETKWHVKSIKKSYRWDPARSFFTVPGIMRFFHFVYESGKKFPRSTKKEKRDKYNKRRRKHSMELAQTKEAHPPRSFPCSIAETGPRPKSE